MPKQAISSLHYNDKIHLHNVNILQYPIAPFITTKYALLTIHSYNSSNYIQNIYPRGPDNRKAQSYPLKTRGKIILFPYNDVI